MAESLDSNVLNERLNQMDTRMANLELSVNSAVGIMMTKIDAVLQKTNICVTPSPNADATWLTAPSLSLLDLAAKGDNGAILRMLGEQTDSSKFVLRAENGHSALHIAAREGHLEAVIIRQDERMENGDTALHIAARKGHLETVKLLSKEAKVDTPGYLLRTPLHCAAYHGHLDVVQCLLESGARADARDAQNKTPLALAAENEETDIVDLLSQSTLQSPQPAIHLESFSNIDLVQCLNENGISIESSSSEKNSLIVQAARSGRWDVVNFLLERGVSATECEHYTQCALDLAASADEADTVRHLLRRGAASDADQVECGLIRVKSAAMVRVFWEEVPDAVRGRAGEWGVICSASGGFLESLSALLDLGVDVDSRDGDGATALSSAAENGHIACVNELLRRGADVNAMDAEIGDTALHRAARYSQEDCVRALLEAGASRTEENFYEKIPMEVTRSEYIRRLFNNVA